MGMAASQARFLGLTARKSNVEYQGQQVNQQRTSLANESANLYQQMMDLTVPTPPSQSDYYRTSYVLDKSGNDYYNSDFEITNLSKTYEHSGEYLVTLSTKVGVYQATTTSYVLSRSSVVSTTTKPEDEIVDTENPEGADGADDAEGTNGANGAEGSNNTENNENPEGANGAEDNTNSENPAPENGEQAPTTGENQPAQNNADVDTNNDDTTVNNNNDATTGENGNTPADNNDVVVDNNNGAATDNNTDAQQSYDKYEIKLNDKTSSRTMTLTYDEAQQNADATDAIQNYQIYSIGKNPEDLNGYSICAKEQADIAYFYRNEDGTNVFLTQEQLDNLLEGNAESTYYFGTTYEYDREKTLQVKAYLESADNGRYTAISIENNPEYEYDLAGKTFSLSTVQEFDEAGYEDAMNDYEYNKALYEKSISDINSQTEQIQAKDQQLELRLQQLNTEQDAIKTEMEAVSKVIQDNVEKTFNVFG